MTIVARKHEAQRRRFRWPSAKTGAQSQESVKKSRACSLPAAELGGFSANRAWSGCRSPFGEIAVSRAPCASRVENRCRISVWRGRNCPADRRFGPRMPRLRFFLAPGPCFVPIRRREVGGGRAPRQSGQVRKEAAPTSSGTGHVPASYFVRPRSSIPTWWWSSATRCTDFLRKTLNRRKKHRLAIDAAADGCEFVAW